MWREKRRKAVPIRGSVSGQGSDQCSRCIFSIYHVCVQVGHAHDCGVWTLDGRCDHTYRPGHRTPEMCAKNTLARPRVGGLQPSACSCMCTMVSGHRPPRRTSTALSVVVRRPCLPFRDVLHLLTSSRTQCEPQPGGHPTRGLRAKAPPPRSRARSSLEPPPEGRERPRRRRARCGGQCV